MKINKNTINLLKTIVKTNPYGSPFSACLLNKRTGLSSYGGNMVTSLNDPTAHAEINTLQQIRYVKDFNPNDYIIISSGEPCPMCLTAIAWSGIKEVYYIDSYKIANKKGFKFDQSSKKVNKFLKLGLKIKQIK